MNTKWFKGLKQTEKEARRKELLSYRNAFDELTKVIEDNFLSEVIPDYSKPGWEGELAQKHGERLMALQILRLIKLKD